ncbi:MAG TPA: phosphatidylglycerophosphatase A [Terriglobia bacterium]|nr:phosphatidylglycerophosphatase A [Terriglobia bacterium]
MEIPAAASKRPTLAVWIATFGGLGYFPVAPGSAGAAAGVAAVVALSRLPIATAWVSVLVGITAAVIFTAGVPAATSAENYFRRKDPGHVVIDEVVGQMVTLLANPRPGWKGLVAAYLLFRAIDVIKPFPARRLEHLKGGWGIMLDDVAAGLWSLVAFTLVGHWLK